MVLFKFRLKEKKRLTEYVQRPLKSDSTTLFVHVFKDKCHERYTTYLPVLNYQYWWTLNLYGNFYQTSKLLPKQMFKENIIVFSILSLISNSSCFYSKRTTSNWYHTHLHYSNLFFSSLARSKNFSVLFSFFITLSSAGTEKSTKWLFFSLLINTKFVPLAGLCDQIVSQWITCVSL